MQSRKSRDARQTGRSDDAEHRAWGMTLPWNALSILPLIVDAACLSLISDEFGRDDSSECILRAGVAGAARREESRDRASLDGKFPPSALRHRSARGFGKKF